MKVRVVLTIDVDPEAWRLVYGNAPHEVREDVRQYALEWVRGSAGVEETGATVRLVNN